MSTEADLKALRYEKAMQKGELQGATLGGLTGAGLGSLASLGYTVARRRPLTSKSSPVLGGLIGFGLGSPTGAIVGALRQHREEKRGKLKKAGAVTPDEVIPPGEHKSPAMPHGALVPRDAYGTYEKLPESLGSKVKRVAGDFKGGWSSAGDAWKQVNVPKNRYDRVSELFKGPIDRLVDIFSDAKPVAGIDLMMNRLKGAQSTSRAFRMGGASRMLAPHVGAAVGTLVPAAMLYGAFKEKKKKK